VKSLTSTDPPGKGNSEEDKLSIHQKLKRILQIDQPGDLVNPYFETENQGAMISKVVCRPNPFYTSITVDIACAQSKQVIVRMFDDNDRIVKMFSWYLVKGINVTTINDVSGFSGGRYILDIVDLEGDMLYSTQLNKE
jgi:hypothetical protein